MGAHGSITIENRGHEGVALGNERIARHGADPSGRLIGLAVLAEKHRRIHEQMEIVAAGGGVEVLVAGIVEIFIVRHDRSFALRDGLRIVAAEHVDMRRHVLEMAGVRRVAAQHVRSLESTLGSGRHLEGMDVHVEQPGVDGALALDPVHPDVQGPQDLGGAGMRIGLSGREIPELTRCAGHRGLDMKGDDDGVILVSEVNVTHRIGIVAVPGVQDVVIPFVGVSVSLGECLDEGLFGQRRIGGKCHRGLHGVMTDRQGAAISASVYLIQGRL